MSGICLHTPQLPSIWSLTKNFETCPQMHQKRHCSGFAINVPLKHHQNQADSAHHILSPQKMVIFFEDFFFEVSNPCIFRISKQIQKNIVFVFEVDWMAYYSWWFPNQNPRRRSGNLMNSIAARPMFSANQSSVNT